MNNNSKNGYDLDVYNTSLSKAIRVVSHPCESFQEKIDIVTKKWENHKGSETDIEKIAAFRSFFKEYYENIDLYNFYGLVIIEPWV